mmetsp:Transcript_42588/g.67361  ORF Transcript_42588/g.67361 Transcript_42588/m.67361 type:complete len:252 (-) Transcript_42588:194-949(-)
MCDDGAFEDLCSTNRSIEGSGIFCCEPSFSSSSSAASVSSSRKICSSATSCSTSSSTNPPASDDLSLSSSSTNGSPSMHSVGLTTSGFHCATGGVPRHTPALALGGRLPHARLSTIAPLEPLLVLLPDTLQPRFDQLPEDREFELVGRPQLPLLLRPLLLALLQLQLELLPLRDPRPVCRVARGLRLHLRPIWLERMVRALLRLRPRNTARRKETHNAAPSNALVASGPISQTLICGGADCSRLVSSSSSG